MSRAKIAVGDLKVGMYVCELDRPWLDTPFLFQGFRVESSQDIDTLLDHCTYVYIDIEGTYLGGDRQLVGGSRISRAILLGRSPVVHEDKSTIEEELPVAKRIFNKLSATFDAFLDDVKSGSALALKQLKPDIDLMVDSMCRNPDAFVWLARLKTKDDYTYRHSMSCAIWAVAFGRQLGLRKFDLQQLAMAVSLIDIGKLKIPSELLNKQTKLTEEEFFTLRGHVEFGLELVSNMQGSGKHILETVGMHHERFDGSGYPNKIIGNDIPLFARIAAIVDCYDAITSERPYAEPIAPAVAVKKLYEWRDRDFQTELVEEFIQAIGIYPAGTLVELNSGEVGVVMAEYRTRRLKPKIMMILDKHKQFLDSFPIVDLYQESLKDEGLSYEIVRSLEPGAYGINPRMLYL